MIKIKENPELGHTEFKPVKAGRKVGVEFKVWQTKNPSFKMDTTIWGDSQKDLQKKVQAYFK